MIIFNHFAQEHGLTLTATEERDIIALVENLPCPRKDRCRDFEELGRDLCNTCNNTKEAKPMK